MNLYLQMSSSLRGVTRVKLLTEEEYEALYAAWKELEHRVSKLEWEIRQIENVTLPVR